MATFVYDRGPGRGDDNEGPPKGPGSSKDRQKEDAGFGPEQ